MGKDVSTIKRNKKRIIIKMYEELYKWEMMSYWDFLLI
jgi:hypothetical protein